MSHLWKHRWPDPPTVAPARPDLRRRFWDWLSGPDSWLVDALLLLGFVAGIAAAFWAVSKG